MANQPSKGAAVPGWGATIAGLGAAAMASPTISQSAAYMTSGPVASVPASTSGVNYVDEKLLTAKLEAAEARTETKFAQLLGELRLIGDRVSNLTTTFNDEIKDVKKATATVKWNILATGIALGALILGLFAYGASMVDLAAGIFQAGK